MKSNTKKSLWPLLDELFPPVSVAIPRQVTVADPPSRNMDGYDAATEIQRYITKFFGTVPRNKLKEQGLE